jgi:hypothetical protein
MAAFAKSWREDSRVGEALAISVSRGETAVLEHFQERNALWVVRAGRSVREPLTRLGVFPGGALTEPSPNSIRRVCHPGQRQSMELVEERVVDLNSLSRV